MLRAKGCIPDPWLNRELSGSEYNICGDCGAQATAGVAMFLRCFAFCLYLLNTDQKLMLQVFKDALSALLDCDASTTMTIIEVKYSISS